MISSHLSRQPFFSLINHHRQALSGAFPPPPPPPFYPGTATVPANRASDPFSQSEKRSMKRTPTGHHSSRPMLWNAGDLWFPSGNSPFTIAAASQSSCSPGASRRGSWHATKTPWQTAPPSGPRSANLSAGNSDPHPSS